jgi:toxin ParE1/3/4
MGYRLVDRAEYDMDDIWLYLATESANPEIANQFLRSLYEVFRLLAENPRLGRLRPDLSAGIRSFPTDDYIIVYEIDRTDVVIDRVVRGSRDIERLL